MKVAILIPTMDRHEFVERTVSYYDSLKSIHTLYIGDASDANISRKTLSFLKGINNVSFKYFHWEGLGIAETLVKLAEEASTENDYCSFHGDDDYFIPSSLTECAEFLSNNPDYRTAQGRAALVTMDSPEAVCGINGIGQYWGKNSIESSSRYERYCYFKNNYYVLQFSVHRINEFIHDSRDFVSIRDNGFHEIQHCFTFAISGKSKFLDCLYLVRVRHPELFLHSGENLIERITRPNWSANYATTIDSLSGTLSDDGEMTLSEAKKVVVEMMNERFCREILKEFSNKESIRTILNDSLKNKIPETMKIIMKSTKYFLLDKMGLRPLFSLLRKRRSRNEMELLRSKSSRFYPDFLPVEQSLNGIINDDLRTNNQIKN
jgi:glycosyltransferase domain-containing protein